MGKSSGELVLALCNAADECRLEVMEELLAAGADCNEVLPRGTPLHSTAEFNDRCCQEEAALRAVQLLFARGANPNLTDRYGRTPLHLAVACGHLLIAKALLESGANPNLKHVEGNTPLHTIVETDNQKPDRQREAIVRLLLVHGADLNVTNGKGQRPLDLARARGRADLVALFLAPPATLTRQPAPVPAIPIPVPSAPAPTSPSSSAHGVAVRCPDCGTPGRVPSTFLGKAGKCKRCGVAFVFQKQAEDWAMSSSVQCPGCEKKLRTKEELAGKRVKCPGCGQVILIPAPQPGSKPKATNPSLGKPPVPKKREAETPPPSGKSSGPRRTWIMRFFDRLLGKRDASGDSGSSSAGWPSLESLAFLVTANDVEPPVGETNEVRDRYLSTLKIARQKNVEFRQNFKRQNPMAGLMKDPVDDVVPNSYSLAILFNWENGMDSEYGKQIVRIFLKQLESDQMRKELVLHFGDLFDNYCAIIVRSQAIADIQYVAGRFGADFQAPGLLPHEIRFLRADKKDGHLLARTFSLPLEARLIKGHFHGDKQGGLGRFIKDHDMAGTTWRLG